MNSLARSAVQAEARHWRAYLSLGIDTRPNKSVLAKTAHEGPLRVQRPFYPEKDGCCHVYLLHPPGGMVVGDELEISADLSEKAQALLTTPSAGKIYGAKHSSQSQCQSVRFKLNKGACLEWLPQETIVFDSARGRLSTRIDLEENAKFFGWDIVRLGRVASGETFSSGSCNQSLELWRNNKPVFIERNKIAAGSDLYKSTWGLRNCNTTATLVATMNLSRDSIDGLYNDLSDGLWGLTQKKEIFIARYLGDSISACRSGMELIWRKTRKHFNGKHAVVPRIWNT